MSKITNPITEESVSCGFFNAVRDENGKYDRTYTAEDFGSLFDGLITDGIFVTIGDCFAVTVNEGNTVNVGTGKAWFNKVWIHNDAPLAVDCGSSGSTYNRYDAVVIRIDYSENVKDAFIQVVHGTEASSPAKPEMVHTEYEHWYPICYIYRPKNSSVITVSDIEDIRGDSLAPYVTGIPQTRLPAETLTKWRYEVDKFIAGVIQQTEYFTEEERAKYSRLYAELEDLMATVASDLSDWLGDQQTVINTWFEEIKGKLGTDPAANLQLQLDEIEIKRILANGFVSGIKYISEDGRSVRHNNSERTLYTQTEYSENFNGIVKRLYDFDTNVLLGAMEKTISDDGLTITYDIELNY